MDYEAGELYINGNAFHVQRKKSFVAEAEMLQVDKEACFEFAYGMSYAKMGAHRDSRSGGIIHRTMGQIFINTFQGKMAEFALYRYLEKHHIIVEKPDLEKFDLGKWDSYDLNCQGKYIAIKSTKSYGNLLLLETKDWNTRGEYIPNFSNGISKYDYIVLVRLAPDGESIMKTHNLLEQERQKIPSNIKEMLLEIICNISWQYDLPGFIYYSELVKMIQERRIIPQNALLNGRVKMDAENFYFQVGNMHSMKEIYIPTMVGEAKEGLDLCLKRTCPLCGHTLVLRRGYNWFWGCEGYFCETQCRYTEPMEGR